MGINFYNFIDTASQLGSMIFIYVCGFCAIMITMGILKSLKK